MGGKSRAKFYRMYITLPGLITLIPIRPIHATAANDYWPIMRCFGLLFQLSVFTAWISSDCAHPIVVVIA